MSELVPAQLGEVEQATQALARALVEVWHTCDDVDNGSNLSECLSRALGLAGAELLREEGRSLGTDVFEAGDQLGALLVKHRPGSWEADHVRQLIGPVVGEELQLRPSRLTESAKALCLAISSYRRQLVGHGDARKELEEAIGAQWQNLAESLDEVVGAAWDAEPPTA